RPKLVTMTGPLAALEGMNTEMLVSLQEITEAATLLNLTWPLPWLGPNPEPLTTTVPPYEPQGGVTLVITGLITARETLVLLARELTSTLTGPVPPDVELATVATICEALQLVTADANVPLNLTVLLP